MSTNRRDRARRSRTDRSDSAPGASGGAPGSRASARPAWRETVDSWGGIPVLSVVAIIVLASGFFIFRSVSGQPSTAELMGEEYGDVDRSHVAVGLLTESPSKPPAGGAHYQAPWPTGVFSEEPADGYLVHSLEHGIIWISYQPEMVTPDQLAALSELAENHRRDVILAPRSANDAPLYVMSWGRRLQPDAGDLETIERFIETNVDRAPEPGVR